MVVMYITRVCTQQLFLGSAQLPAPCPTQTCRCYGCFCHCFRQWAARKQIVVMHTCVTSAGSSCSCRGGLAGDEGLFSVTIISSAQSLLLLLHRILGNSCVCNIRQTHNKESNPWCSTLTCKEFIWDPSPGPESMCKGNPALPTRTAP